VSDGLILPILLGFFSLVGVWMFISPEQHVLWVKNARPFPRAKRGRPARIGNGEIHW
jgi:hypothetical protein